MTTIERTIEKTNSTDDTTESITLYYREGGSDKVYQASIEPEGGKYVVAFAYGRRGSALATGLKTPAPVPYAQARAVYDKLVKSKTAKGYTPGPEGTRQVREGGAGGEGRHTGILCQLANPVEENRLPAMLANEAIGAQEKLDGRRLLVLRKDGQTTGINRLGFAIALPLPLRDAVAALPHDCLLDGELVGGTLHAFDLLELAGHDLRGHACLTRLAGLLSLLPAASPFLRAVPTALTGADKRALLERVRADNGEGVVFKDLDAPYLPGRPNSGGAWLKLKFVETATFVTGAVNNGRRSVALRLFDGGGNPVHAGSVTIPPNHEVPAPGTIVEVRYLHAFRESGAVYQPVYLGPRDDIPASDCVTAQLKYKAPAALSA